MTMTKNSANVSAVIPTMGRNTIGETLRSVLSQSLPPREVLVVFDGSPNKFRPFEAAVRADLGMHGDVIRFISTGGLKGGNQARNLGIRLAAQPLVALCDDDDVWRREKLERQLQHRSLHADDTDWLAFSAVETFGDIDGAIWPKKKPPTEAKSIGRYLFARESLRETPRFLQTSTWLAPRTLFCEHPFNPDVRLHQDWDWLINLPEKTRLIYISEPLVLYRTAFGSSVSSESTWKASYDWSLGVSHLLDHRSLHNFWLDHVVARALRDGDISAATHLLLTSKHAALLSKASATRKIFDARRKACGRDD